MTDYVFLPPSEASDAIDLIGKDWMLIGAADGNGANAMTASWGTIGTLWHKPVCICFIRPQRYTFELAENADRLSFSFLGEENRGALTHCGRNSGRNGDKLADAGLPYEMLDGVPVFDSARLTLICRKLYADWLRADSFILKEVADRVYPEKDFHKFYICEIEKCLIRKK